jgi:hypothetical protein
MDYYQKISLWLDIWKTLVEKPSDILLEKSFVNLAKGAAEELELALKRDPAAQIGANAQGWKKLALDRINEAFRKKHPVIPLLKLEHDTEMVNLSSQVASLPYSVPAILPLVQKIKTGLSLQTLEKAIVEELSKNTAKSNRTLYLLTNLLLRNLVTKYSRNSLKDLWVDRLAREGTRFFVRKQIRLLKKDLKLNEDLWETLGDILKTEIDANFLKSLANEKGLTIQEQFDFFRWESNVERFLADLNILFFNEIKTLISAENSTGAILGILRRRSDLHRRVGNFATSWFVEAFTKTSIQAGYGSLISRNDSRICSVGKDVVEFLQNQVEMANNRSFGSRFSINIQRSAEKTLGDAAAIGLSKTLPDLIAISDFQLKKLGKNICESVADLIIKKGCLLVSWLPKEELEILVLEWSTSRSFHKSLKSYFKGIHTKLIDRLPQAVEDFAYSSIAPSEAKTEFFWNEWQNLFASYSSIYGDLIHYLPWGSCRPRELRQIINAVFNGLSSPAKQFTVNLDIKGFDATDKNFWSFDDIIFYSAEAHNLGERLWLLNKTQTPSIRAQVCVEAETKYEAGVKGWLRLQEVLSSFSLGLGIQRSWGGFDPKISSQVFVFDISTRSWIAERANSTRGDTAIEQTLGNVKYIADKFEYLLKSAKNPAVLNELQKKVMSAFYWYGKGRWKEDPAETYVFYWIGIEGIFGESSREPLFKSICRFLITWRDIYGYSWTSLMRMQEALLKMIRTDPDIPRILASSRKFSTWDQKIQVLLNLKKVDLLITLIPPGKTSIADYAKLYRDYLNELKIWRRSIPKALAMSIENFNFKLLLLKNLRNQMAHEGTFYIPEMLLYNEELEEIFEKILAITGNEAIQPTPFYSNLQKLISDGEKNPIT